MSPCPDSLWPKNLNSLRAPLEFHRQRDVALVASSTNTVNIFLVFTSFIIEKQYILNKLH